MGFLHNFWDETLAGPAPEKLHKYDSMSAVRSPPPPLMLPQNNRHYVDDNSGITVSRCITIVRSNSGSIPSSPVTPTTPSTPFSPSMPGGDFRKLTRRKSAPPERFESGDARNPAVYDWLVLNALDR